MAEFRRATGLPTATNMIATDWRQMAHAIQLQSVDIPARRSAFLDHAGLGAGRADCATIAASPGVRIPTTISTSRSRCSRMSRQPRPGKITAIDTHWIWQDGQRLTQEPLQIVGGQIAVPDRPGLGIEIDMDGARSSPRTLQDPWARRARRRRSDAIPDSRLEIRQQASLPGALKRFADGQLKNSNGCDFKELCRG